MPKKKGSQAEWNRVRKDSLKQELATLTTPPRAPRQDLPESLQKEVSFQRQKAQKRKAEALNDGLLLSDEVTPALKLQAEQLTKENAKKDKSHLKWSSGSIDTESALAFLQGTAWFHSSLGIRSLAACKKKLATLGMASFTEERG